MKTSCVHFDCGHTALRDISEHRPIDGDEIRHGLCPTCKAEEARIESERFGLSTLQGTAKQIAWAHDIRAEKMVDVDVLLNCQTDFPDAKRLAELLRGLERLRKRPSAAWWIDNQYLAIEELIALA